MELLDDDLIDVVLVLAVLFIGVAGIAILLAKVDPPRLTISSPLSVYQKIPQYFPVLSAKRRVATSTAEASSCIT